MSYSVRRQSGISTYSVNEFEWTTDRPREIGWYWATYEKASEAAIVEVDERDGEMAVIEDDGGVVDLGYWNYWIGPLPMPFAIERDLSAD